MKPNEERQAALSELNLVVSRIKTIAKLWPRNVWAERQRETESRTAQRTVLPGLSEEAKQLAFAIYKTHGLPHKQKRSEIQSLLKHDGAFAELKTWNVEADRRFGEAGKAARLPGIDPQHAENTDALRSIVKVSVTVGGYEIETQGPERQRERGIERDDIGWSR